MMKNKLFVLTLLTALCLAACSAPDPLKDQPTLPVEPIGGQTSGAPDTGSQDGTEASASSESLADSAIPSKSAEPETDCPFQLEIPEGFAASEMEGYPLFYLSADGSNINMNIQEKDASFQTLTADIMRNALEDAYKQVLDMDVELTDNYFNMISVDGFPAYQYSFTYVLDEKTITQLIVGIDGDSTYTFTFTDMSGEYMELFESCASSIHYSR